MEFPQTRCGTFGTYKGQNEIARNGCLLLPDRALFRAEIGRADALELQFSVRTNMSVPLNCRVQYGLVDAGLAAGADHGDGHLGYITCEFCREGFSAGDAGSDTGRDSNGQFLH